MKSKSFLVPLLTIILFIPFLDGCEFIGNCTFEGVRSGTDSTTIEMNAIPHSGPVILYLAQDRPATLDTVETVDYAFSVDFDYVTYSDTTHQKGAESRGDTTYLWLDGHRFYGRRACHQLNACSAIEPSVRAIRIKVSKSLSSRFELRLNCWSYGLE